MLWNLIFSSTQIHIYLFRTQLFRDRTTGPVLPLTSGSMMSNKSCHWNSRSRLSVETSGDDKDRRSEGKFSSNSLRHSCREKDVWEQRRRLGQTTFSLINCPLLSSLCCCLSKIASFPSTPPPISFVKILPSPLHVNRVVLVSFSEFLSSVSTFCESQITPFSLLTFDPWCYVRKRGFLVVGLTYKHATPVTHIYIFIYFLKMSLSSFVRFFFSPSDTFAVCHIFQDLNSGCRRHRTAQLPNCVTHFLFCWAGSGAAFTDGASDSDFKRERQTFLVFFSLHAL